MSLSVGGNKHKDKGTSSIDTKSQQYINAQEDAARRAGAAGPSPLLTNAAGFNTGLMNAGNLGVNALSGNADATASLMNPYQQQVIGALNAQWDKTGQMAQNSVADAATRAGAFGGTRQGVAEGVAQANNNLNRNSQIGGLLYGGFNDAMGRAQNLAQAGFAGSQANANLGFGGVGSPDQWMAEMMKRYYGGPMGGQTNGSGYGFSATGSNAGMGG